MTGRLWIRGGRVVDPSLGLDRCLEVEIAAGRVLALWKPSRAPRPGSSDKVIDASGMWVLPGLVDLHVHFRQPGDEQSEDLLSGSRAAAAGGVTTVLCQPNTRPVLDRPSLVAEMVRKAASIRSARVLFAGALSRGLRGRSPAPVEGLVRAGAMALSDDGVGTGDTGLLRDVMARAAAMRVPVLLHCQDRRIAPDGMVGSAAVARRFDLPYLPERAEWIAVKNAMRAARGTGAKVHIQHVSCERTIEEIERARAEGVRVSCEVTPHHLFLDASELLKSGRPDPNLKMNPPLRPAGQVEALRQAVGRGLVDVIATDHAPHSATAKSAGFRLAPFGVTGLETLLSLVVELAGGGVLPLLDAVALVTCRPAAILGVEAGSLRPGAVADAVVFDPRERWTVARVEFRSKSWNSAFLGRQLEGRVAVTISRGRVVFRRRRS